MGGGFNTAATYCLYLVLLQLIDYRLAYTISYVSGIALAYAVNRHLVFRSHRGWRSVVAFPFVYLVQYAVGLAVVYVWVKYLHLPAEPAPLLSIVLTIPVTYVLSRLIFGRSRIGADSDDRSAPM